MITIVFLAPYIDIKEEIELTLREYNPPEPIQASVHAMDVDQVEGATFHADVIIARGFSAAKLRERMPGQLVVPLQTSAYDVIDAVSAAISLHAAHKVALIGPPGMISMVERSSRIFDAEITSYQTTAATNLPEMVRVAKADGCDCFVGGLSLVKACTAAGEKSVLLRTGRPAIIGSLEEAIRLAQSTREQRETSAFFKTILDHTKEGVVSLDEKGLVTSINSSAARYLSLENENCLGRPAEQVFPFPLGNLQAAFAGGEAVENELRSCGERMLAITCVPLPRERHAAGRVVFLRSVNRLQIEESIIRQKIQARGQKAKYRFADIVRRSDAVSRAVDKARLFAGVDSPVLIVGESGTGKELFAQSIHNDSRRGAGPFIAINCAALTESLLESELFGYSDGAFTGAIKGGREGLFEAAHGGTIFLDEISEIPVPFQSKLLRVLQENEIRRLGSQRVVAIDARIIAATNRDLSAMVEMNLFRRDLLYRLNVLHLRIPPLHRRPEDVRELFARYTEEYSAKYGKTLGVITSDAWAVLEGHGWPGNVRELKNIAERLCVLGKGDVITADAVRDALLDEAPNSGPGDSMNTNIEEAMPESERERLVRLLHRYAGNRGLVADALGCNRSTIWRKMKKYGL